MPRSKALAWRCSRRPGGRNWKPWFAGSNIAGWKRIRASSIFLSKAASLNRSERMFEFRDQPSQVKVQESEYLRLLGYPARHQLEGRARELFDWAREWYAAHGRPWIYAAEAGGIAFDGKTIHVRDAEFCSDRLKEQLAGAEAHDAVLLAVSAGKQCEEAARECW